MQDPSRSTLFSKMRKRILESKSRHKLLAALTLFRLKGKSYNLSDHYFFRPLFRIDLPRKVLYKCARQVGKSQNMSVAKLSRTISTPYYNSLFVCPRFEQIKRISNNNMRPLIAESPCKELFLEKGVGKEQSVLQRTFRNGSIHYYSFAFLDAERIRSIACNNVNYDEVQDILWEFLPVIAETMSGSKLYRDELFTGTPKTFDNTIDKLWNESSMAAWTTQCQACNYWNIASAEHDLLKMLGKKGVSCAKCGRVINPREGGWVHANPSKQSEFVGYHVPQAIHPVHFESEDNWRDLLNKMRLYPTSKFWNECLGESYDSATKLMSLNDIRRVSTEDKPNTLRDALFRKRDYSMLCMGIDWGGGGDESESYTAVVIAGTPRSGGDAVDVLYATKLNRNMPPHEETQLILDLITRFNPDLIAHDYGGAGNLREVMLIQAGVPPEKLIPYTYSVTGNKDVIYFNGGAAHGSRSSYTIDKPRSLVTLCAMIKGGKVRLPEYESSVDCFSDFVNLVEHLQERPRGSDVFLISKAAGTCDDICHATNYACSCIWYSKQQYPNLAEALAIKLSHSDADMIAPRGASVDWR